MLEGLRGKESIADLSYSDEISQGIYTNGPMASLRLRNSSAQASSEQGRSEFYRARTPLHIFRRWHLVELNPVYGWRVRWRIELYNCIFKTTH